MSERFFTKINYSASNEDSRSELAALQLTDKDTVLCITGSGARPLDLLTATPKRIVSIDFNPAQNHLLNLKVAAWRTLECDEFQEFIGLSPNSNRLKYFDHVSQELCPTSHRFWRENQRKIRRGLLYCGTWEKLLRGMSKLTWLRQRHVNGLLHAPDLEAQRAYWQKHWTGRFLKNMLHVVFNRTLWTKVIREPGAKLISKDFDVPSYMFRCLEKMAHDSLLRENPYANLLLFGKYTQHCKLPLHLRRDHYQLIKKQLDKLEVVTAPLEDYLIGREARFDAYSLSDFSSYAPQADYDSIWQSIAFSARDQARFCERFFLVKQASAARERLIVRDGALENQLQSHDYTCLYSFAAGRIKGDFGPIMCTA